MTIPPHYTISPSIAKSLAAIEASKQIIETIEVPKELEIKIRRESTLRSSLFSAKIEGNPLTLEELPYTSPQDIKKIEIFNILEALQELSRSEQKTTTKANLLKIHSIVMDGLTSDLGKLRTEASAIFNSAGVAIYMTPPPQHLQDLLENLFEYINSDKETIIPIKACLAHFSFEKIHPFLDGNGRVGRILLQQILKQNGYDMKGMLSIEEYLDDHRSLYYQALDNNPSDVTEFLTFMLGAIAESAEKVKKLILEKKDFTKEDFLLPRRLEILNIIRDHKIVNFDQIRRRFIAVNERLLRYDLKKLIDGGYIKKRGTTKGVYYEAKE